jgi:hypothetical protein
MNDLRKHGWKFLVVLALWLLASHWDYKDSQRIQARENWARVANR